MGGKHCKHLIIVVVATYFGDSSYTMIALMRLFRNDYCLPEPRDTLKTINRLSYKPTLM